MRELGQVEQLQAAMNALHSAATQIVQISFLGDKTYEAILSRTVRRTGVDFAILQGTISRLKHIPYGLLTVRFEGEGIAIRDTIRQLVDQGLDVEVIC